MCLWGCQSTYKTIEQPNKQPIKLRLLPEDYFYEEVYNVQINSVPMPFYLAHAYVVWVNGERVELNRVQVHSLAQSLDLPMSPAPDTQKFHNGDGWIRPLKLADNE